jgi:hypothetical protein
MAAQIAERMRNAAYEASVALAQEKGAFPLFNVKGYLAEGTFASRLPQGLQAKIRQHGIRNNAHQTNMAAAVHQRHTASRNLLSECSRRVGIGGIMAGG